VLRLGGNRVTILICNCQNFDIFQKSCHDLKKSCHDYSLTGFFEIFNCQKYIWLNLVIRLAVIL